MNLSVFSFDYNGKRVRLLLHKYLVFVNVADLSRLTNIEHESILEDEWTPIAVAYSEISISGNVALCVWLNQVTCSILPFNIWKKEYAPLFEMAVTATSHYCSLYKDENYRLSVWLNRISEFIPDARLVKWGEVKARLNIVTSKRPDFIVESNGKFIPGEAKVKPFTLSHLNQLKGYMKIIGATEGYAVAPSLKVKLPKGIHYLGGI